MPAGRESGSYKITEESYIGDGTLINSDFLDGLNVSEAKKEVLNRLSALGIAKNKINYKLRDWGISRQRYWGCPIPVMYREDGEIVPVDYKSLPVKLPSDINFDTKGNPLDENNDW